MAKDLQKSKPQGKRYLVKKPCAACDSKGYLSSEGQKKCEKCKGIGWIVNRNNKFTIGSMKFRESVVFMR